MHNGWVGAQACDAATFSYFIYLADTYPELVITFVIWLGVILIGVCNVQAVFDLQFMM